MEWNQTYGGADYEQAYSLVETSDGGYALTGTTNTNTDVNIWLVKTGLLGKMEWNQTYGGPKVDRVDSAQALVETSDGGYAVVGSTYSFGAGGDGWLIKTNAEGAMEWNQTYGGADDDWASALVQTKDGGYALAGARDLVGPKKGDAWLVKTDADGNMQWNQTYGGTRYDLARGLVQASDGGYAMAGSTEIESPDHSAFGELSTLLIKTNENGVVPEFGSWTVLPLILTVTLFIVFLKKR